MKPQPVDIEAVRAVARLARLRLSSDEERSLSAELGAIVEHIASIAVIEVVGVAPTSQMGTGVTAFRPDTPEPSLLREDVLGSAPKSVDGSFAVPKILDGEG